VSGQLHDPVTLPLGKETLIPPGYEAGWAPEPIWTRWQRENKSHFCPCLDLNPDRQARSPVCILELSRLFLFWYFTENWSFMYYNGMKAVMTLFLFATRKKRKPAPLPFIYHPPCSFIAAIRHTLRHRSFLPLADGTPVAGQNICLCHLWKCLLCSNDFA